MQGREPETKDAVVVAGIDCGTNSIRLKVSRVDQKGSHDLLPRMLRVIRLGQGVDQTHSFSPQALDRAFAAAGEFARVLRQYPVEGMRFVATSASRDAENRQEFEDGMESILGVRPEVITGTEEAALSFLGACSSLPQDSLRAPYLVVDLGGGSTEFVLGGDGVESPADQVREALSMNIGSVRMTERHLLDAPPTDEQIQEAVADINRHIDQAFKRIQVGRTGSIIGVSGTVTTMAALALGLTQYDHAAVDGARISIQDALAVDERVLRSSRTQLRSCKTIHPGRVDVAAGGALVWSRILVRLAQAVTETQGRNLDSFISSEHGLLDGLVLDYGRKLLAKRS
ncbi:exopolyphosphatase [Bifidobacterium aemilianum]|uniref:Exopolyphosphatase n=1 Tax=Bifidobacterium aemilianum TaxID=2493120 RepID=A0A366K9K7_9BIFI|nr:exopolyphosphatase [Bifidobacterium aemilianum]